MEVCSSSNEKKNDQKQVFCVGPKQVIGFAYNHLEYEYRTPSDEDGVQLCKRYDTKGRPTLKAKVKNEKFYGNFYIYSYSENCKRMREFTYDENDNMIDVSDIVCVEHLDIDKIIDLFSVDEERAVSIKAAAKKNQLPTNSERYAKDHGCTPHDLVPRIYWGSAKPNRIK
jgi:hypothetical protein